MMAFGERTIADPADASTTTTVSQTPPRPRRCRVIMMPDYRQDNPYQKLLAEALSAEDVDVLFPTGYRRVFPLWRAVRDNSPIDVLHLHWPEAYSKGRGLTRWVYWFKLLLDLWLVRLSGVRVVWTLHNLLPHDCRHPRQERWLRSWLTRMTDHTIVHGEQSRRDAQRELHCRADCTTLIPHGHYREIYPPLAPSLRANARLGIRDEERVFLFFGMMRPYKGLEKLLGVWRNLRPANSRLWIRGACADEHYERQLRLLAEGMPDVQLEVGFLSSEALAAAFAGCDAVILPFENVQTSGSAILAVSYGRPVITPRLGELPELFSSADDLLYDASDPDGLANTIRHAMQMDLANFGRRIDQLGDRLSWDNIARKTARVYRTS